jgi:hypothetical protein
MADETIAALRDAVRLNPDVAAKHGDLGQALLAAGCFADAAKEFGTAVELDPNDAAYHAGLAHARLARWRFAEAAKLEFQKAVELDKANAAYHAGLGQALVALHSYDDAKGQFREALRIEQGNMAYSASLGLASRRQRWRRLATRSVPVAALIIVAVMIIFSAADLRSQLFSQTAVTPKSPCAPNPVPNVTGNLTAKLLAAQRGEADFGRSLTTRTLVVDLSLSAIPVRQAFSVRVNPFLRSDDASLNCQDITATATSYGSTLILTVSFDRNTPGKPLGDPGLYTGSVTIDDSQLKTPVTVPMAVTMQYTNGTFLLWLYLLAIIPGAWCVWVLRSSRNGTDGALSSDFLRWSITVGGLVALVAGGIAAFAVYTAVYLRDPTWGSSALQPLTLYGGMFSAFVTTSGLASLTSQKVST